MMTVKELIAWLSDMNQEAVVKLYDKYVDVNLDLEAIASDGTEVTLIGDC